MDYEKKYKEALNKAKKLMTTSAFFDRFTIESIFPELKESEDEKIRKWLISQLKIKSDDTNSDLNITINKAISWLEKQGEQKPQGKTALEAINEEKVDNANNVKSPFHEGDWIINNNTKIVFLIKYYSFYLNCYTLEDIKGNTYSPCIAPTEEDYHLWSIKDAKPGDILVYEDSIFIFNEICKNCLIYYGIYEDNKFHNDKSYSSLVLDTININNIHPATKEQCATLMKAMADAGYTFDFERKELKKIEKKPTNSIWHDNKCIPDKDDKEILVEYNLNNSTRPNHLFHDVAPYDSSSKMFHCYSMHLKLEEIIRWAYMDDILQVVSYKTNYIYCVSL